MPPENCIGLEIRNLSNLIRRDVEKHADRDHRRDQVSPPIADERQCKSLRGEAFRDHANVEHRLEEDKERHAKSK